MKHKKNDRIVITETKISKIISDCELICDTEIYYMTDNTSYALSQISLFDYTQSSIHNVIESNKESIIKIFDTEKLAENCVRYMKNNTKSKYSLSLLLNLFPKVSRLWTLMG